MYIVETSGLGLHHSFMVQLAPELEDTATVFFPSKNMKNICKEIQLWRFLKRHEVHPTQTREV